MSGSLGKTICITGASRGLGKSMALLCAEAGYDLWLTYQNNDAKAQEVEAEVKSKGVDCKLMKFDIADSESSKNCLSEALKETTPWGLINNAGVARDGLFVRMKEDQWDTVVNTGLKGFYNVTQPIVSAMLRKKEGRVINISSVVGMSGNPGQVNYASAKAGLIGATKALALEVAKRNITVNCITPGFISTEMTEELNQEELTKQIPLGRLGEPEHIAEMALFLLSQKSDYMTGQVISINGGIYM
jgi:3-oxoacyl-[acyl-carrier protein] reductase